MSMTAQLTKIASRLKLLLTPSILEAVYNDGEVQTVKVSLLNGETIDNVPRVEEYGRTSYPPDDSEMLVGCVGGNRAQSLILKTALSTQRPKAQEKGDFIDWDIHGNTVKFTADGIKITAVGGAVIDVNKNGNIVLNGGSLDVARATDPVSVTLSPTDIQVLAAALLTTTAFVASGSVPVPSTSPVPLTGGKIVSGNTTIKG